jgi:hypothetical protein
MMKVLSHEQRIYSRDGTRAYASTGDIVATRTIIGALEDAAGKMGLTEREAILAMRLSIIPKEWVETAVHSIKNGVVTPEDWAETIRSTWLDDLSDRSRDEIAAFIKTLDLGGSAIVLLDWVLEELKSIYTKHDKDINDLDADLGDDSADATRISRIFGMMLTYFQIVW